MIIAFIFCVLLIAIDQVTKYIAVLKLEPISSITVVNGFFDLTFIKNEGAAFGVFQGARWVFIALTTLVLLFLIYYYYKIHNRKSRSYSLLRLSLVLIISGALGNYIDRIRTGSVIDFFHIRFIEFPVFNMADIFVVVGSFIFAILLLFFIEDDKNGKL